MKRTVFFTTCILILNQAAWSFHPGAMPLPERDESFRQRVRQVIEANATAANVSDPSNGWYQHIATNLWLGRNQQWASQRVVEILSQPISGDMFWMFPVTAVAFLGQNQLSPEARSAIREAWRTYMPMRGDTENHWVMYYVCLYLMSQLYPDDPGETWFTGKSSRENMEEAEGWLLHWMDLTTTIGQGEYDCTHYIGVFLMPLSYLVAWAEDPVMRQRATILLEWLMADFAAKNLDGVFTGAHARTDDRAVLERWGAVSSDFYWLLFGTGFPYPNSVTYSYYTIFYCVSSAYQPPAVIHEIATDRREPHVLLEHKRTRHRWRNSDIRNAPVYKTNYLHRDFAMGSDQGGLLQPIQQHSWSLTWHEPDPRGKHNTIFSLHPYASSFELQMYFTEMPDFMVEAVTRQGKPTYNKPDTFLGGSRHEQIFQHKDAIIALYDIAEEAMWHHINGFFSKDLQKKTECASGWIFARGGNTFLAYYPMAPYEWKPIEGGGQRLYSPHRRNGTILLAASVEDFAGFAEFMEAIRSLPLEVSLDPVPSVRLTTLRGDLMEAKYGAIPMVNGTAVNYDEWPLFQSPFMEAKVGSRKLILRHGLRERVLDYGSLRITDSIRKP